MVHDKSLLGRAESYESGFRPDYLLGTIAVAISGDVAKSPYYSLTS